MSIKESQSFYDFLEMQDQEKLEEKEQHYKEVIKEKTYISSIVVENNENN